MKQTIAQTKKYDLLLFGETLIDIFVDQDGVEHHFFGGSPANICINTKRLGLKPILCSCLGNDDFGKFLLSKLHACEIDTSLIQNALGRTSIVKVNQSTTTPTPVFYRGCDSEISLNEDLIEAVKQAKILHFSYWPLTQNPAKDTLLSLIPIAKSAQTLISFDPNIHPDIITNTSISKAELSYVLQHVDFIKPSLDDLKRLFQESLSKETFMTRLEAYSIQYIMMTLGKDGVYVSNNNQRMYFPANASSIVDATGAGDAYWSGFYLGYLHHLSLDDCVAIGQTASSFVINQIGTLLKLNHASQLKHMITPLSERR